MSWVDLILNIAGLLLWLNWRAGKVDPLIKRTPATLAGTLRRAEPARIQRWHLPIALGALLFLRAVFYWLIGSALGWAATLNLGVIFPTFRSSWFGSILLFSVLSFALTLGIFYSWLLLLSLLKGPKPIHNFVRMQLGRIDDWSTGVKIILPLIVTAISWLLASWVLSLCHVIPMPASAFWRLEQSLIIGLESYLLWKFPMALLLLLHLLNSYIYFGRHPLWDYADKTARTLLLPLRKIPLRLGKVDFAPLVGIVLVFLAAQLAFQGLDHFFKAQQPR